MTPCFHLVLPTAWLRCLQPKGDEAIRTLLAKLSILTLRYDCFSLHQDCALDNKQPVRCRQSLVVRPKALCFRAYAQKFRKKAGHQGQCVVIILKFAKGKLVIWPIISCVNRGSVCRPVVMHFKIRCLGSIGSVLADADIASQGLFH